MLKIFRFA